MSDLRYLEWLVKSLLALSTVNFIIALVQLRLREMSTPVQLYKQFKQVRDLVSHLQTILEPKRIVDIEKAQLSNREVIDSNTKRLDEHEDKLGEHETILGSVVRRVGQIEKTLGGESD